MTKQLLRFYYLCYKIDLPNRRCIMTSKQSQYTITYDDFNDSFLCNIDGETISANFVGEILSYIAKIYDYEPKIIYSELHYAKVLENELNITIEIKD